MRKYITYLAFLITLFLGFESHAQENVFKKKSYQEKEIPTYQSSLNQLPKLIYDRRPKYIRLYDKAWELAFSNLMKPKEGSAFISNWIDEGLCEQIFQWDTHFCIQFGKYADHIFSFIGSHDNFYHSQHEDGMICRVINPDGTDHWWGLGENNARAINPPLFSWAEWENFLITGDDSRFESIIPVLEKYGKFIDDNRIGKNTPHQLYWSNGQASGMDNTPRDTGRSEPTDGYDCHSAFDPMGWVDMSSQMVMHYHYLSLICRQVGHDNEAVKYSKKAKEIASSINEWMWDENSGLYYDVDTLGVKTPWITVATFWPLLAGVCNESQAEKLVKNLTDPELFWRLIPLPSLAYGQEQFCDSGRYWRGGTWAPTNYMAVKGLQKNGYYNVAKELSLKFMEGIWEVYKQTGTLWEVYSSERFMPSTNASDLFLCKPDFAGWTALGPISMMIENVIGIDCNALENEITWLLTEDKRHGIENLHFNGSVIDLIAEKIDNSYRLDITTDKKFTLRVKDGDREKVIHIKPGHISIDF